MKKRTKVILGVIIGVLFVYSVIATVGMRSMINELEQKTTDYEIMKESYLEEKEKNIKLEFEKAVK
jgi:hypothetical protein